MSPTVAAACILSGSVHGHSDAGCDSETAPMHLSPLATLEGRSQVQQPPQSLVGNAPVPLVDVLKNSSSLSDEAHNCETPRAQVYSDYRHDDDVSVANALLG